MKSYFDLAVEYLEGKNVSHEIIELKASNLEMAKFRARRLFPQARTLYLKDWDEDIVHVYRSNMPQWALREEKWAPGWEIEFWIPGLTDTGLIDPTSITIIR